MSFWEHGEQQKQKQLSQPNKFLVFFVFKNRKEFLKTLNKQAIKFSPSHFIQFAKATTPEHYQISDFVRIAYPIGMWVVVDYDRSKS